MHQIIRQIRDEQATNEPQFLERQAELSDGWRLVAVYHLLRAAEIVAEYTELGSASGLFDPVEQAELHFDRARDAATEAGEADLSFLVGLLEFAARSLIERSIWRIVRGAGTRATAFVEQLANRNNEEPFLELLPLQHKALVDEGLMGTGRRSVVISLPTSAGKTLVAEFRILQALDSYEAQLGWVAYIAPTRALVNQLTARLRRDFSPLGIRVERFSPALEVDSVEAEILDTSDDPFRVVVTTPEKLDLLLRGGWVSDLGRPLSLVIVDEAHNLGSGGRGLKLELLLATINREARDASFLLMTPFIPNAEEIASWLDPANNQAVEIGLEWLPNDRVVGLAKLEKVAPRGNARIFAETLITSAPSLQTEQTVELAKGRPLGLSYSKLNAPTTLATAAAQALSERGSTVTLVGQPRYSWTAAERLANSIGDDVQDDLVESVGNLLADEYGQDYPLARLLRKGVAVHHAGLSDDVRLMIEALAERGILRHIVATTTLAQGINFPISNVVLGSYQYPYGEPMPPEDFWNIAGRAGRTNHGQPGVILLAAHDAEREATLRAYLASAAEELNSTLIAMVEEALERFGELDLARLSFMGSWSSFVQFITHTYRIVGAEEFSVRVEQVLRGTLGFRELRASQPAWADALVQSVQVYTSRLSGKAISLVDSTGFSWESVSATLSRMSESGVGEQLLSDELFAKRSTALGDAIGVLLRVPELREQLVERLDPAEFEGDFLSRVVKDWVGGMPLGDLAENYFTTSQDGNQRDHTEALTRCCQRLFGSILPTVSWGLSALQALALAGRTDEVVTAHSRDVPSYVYYGVDTREAVALRLFGVPRTAALALARTLGEGRGTEELREFLSTSSPDDWTGALGAIGQSYYDVWRLVEPVT
ncbi:MAG: DEAD/DEAH box helicase [Acidimicrobiaceae bacterium]|nr:DEAD/DEAH box helicase [Acidimicrobiaceae bacterium]